MVQIKASSLQCDSLSGKRAPTYGMWGSGSRSTLMTRFTGRSRSALSDVESSVREPSSRTLLLRMSSLPPDVMVCCTSYAAIFHTDSLRGGGGGDSAVTDCLSLSSSDFKYASMAFWFVPARRVATCTHAAMISARRRWWRVHGDITCVQPPGAAPRSTTLSPLRMIQNFCAHHTR